MILRSPVTTKPAPRLQVFAVGSITSGDSDLRARSFFNPGDVVEHTVNRWTEGKWVAEVRINGSLQGRAIFSGVFAQVDAKTWCDTLAPVTCQGGQL